MKFTIAIPTYNNAATLGRAIESCLNQNYDRDDYEVIVVDNASTDSTAEVLDEYSHKVVSFRNTQTCSMYANHNICLEKSNGDYIVFCHSDDQLLNDCLRKYDSVLKKRDYPNKIVIWGRSLFRDFKTEWDRSELPLDTVMSGEEAFKVFTAGGLTPSGTCYSRQCFISIGGFYALESISAPADTITYWKLIVDCWEFEMSSRLMFRRTEASTAAGNNYTVSKRIEAITEAYEKAFEDDEIFRLYIRRAFNGTTQNYISDVVLVRLKVFDKWKVFRASLVVAISKPNYRNLANICRLIGWSFLLAANGTRRLHKTPR